MLLEDLPEAQTPSNGGQEAGLPAQAAECSLPLMPCRHHGPALSASAWGKLVGCAAVPAAHAGFRLPLCPRQGSVHSAASGLRPPAEQTACAQACLCRAAPQAQSTAASMRTSHASTTLCLLPQRSSACRQFQVGRELPGHMCCSCRLVTTKHVQVVSLRGGTATCLRPAGSISVQSTCRLLLESLCPCRQVHVSAGRSLICSAADMQCGDAGKAFPRSPAVLPAEPPGGCLKRWLDRGSHSLLRAAGCVRERVAACHDGCMAGPEKQQPAGTYEFSVLGQLNLLTGTTAVDYHDFCFGDRECGFPELVNGSCQSCEVPLLQLACHPLGYTGTWLMHEVLTWMLCCSWGACLGDAKAVPR